MRDPPHLSLLFSLVAFFFSLPSLPSAKVSRAMSSPSFLSLPPQREGVSRYVLYRDALSCWCPVVRGLEFLLACSGLARNGRSWLFVVSLPSSAACSTRPRAVASTAVSCRERYSLLACSGLARIGRSWSFVDYLASSVPPALLDSTPRCGLYRGVLS